MRIDFRPSYITLSDLTTEPAIGGISLTWTVPEETGQISNHYATEIWASRTNSHASTTLVASVQGSSYVFPAPPGEVWYFWIRSTNVWGRTDSPWHPLVTAETSGDTGWKTPGSYTNSDFGSSTTANLSNVTTEDGNFAVVTTVVGDTDQLCFYNFDFTAVPSNSTIVDIEYKIKAKADATTGDPYIEVLLNNDGVNYPSTFLDYASTITYDHFLTSTNTMYTGGGTTSVQNTWGFIRNYDQTDSYPFSASVVKSSSFGIVPYLLRLDPSINTVYSFDYVALKVYYTTGGGVQGTAGQSTNADFQINEGDLFIAGGNINMSGGGGVNTVSGSFSTTFGGFNSTWGGVNIGGNLTFEETGQRITGDFNNGTLTNRTAIVHNGAGATYLSIIPGAINTDAGMDFYNLASMADCSVGSIEINGSTDFKFVSGKLGTGTYLPMTFHTGNAERLRISTTSTTAISVGTSTLPAAPLVAHIVVADGGLITAAGDLQLGSNLTYESGPAWKAIAADVSSLIQIRDGHHKFWTGATVTNPGDSPTLTERFRIQADNVYSYLPYVVTGGAIQVTGSNTPAGGGGLELHYLSSEGYVQALDRTGTVWKPLNVSGSVLNFKTGNVLAMHVDANQNVRAGVASLATTATNGFLYIPSCAGAPTGVPTAVTGMAPMVVDSTNNKLYVYIGGAWRVMN